MSGANPASGVKERFVDSPSGKVRVWEKGRGKRIGFFAGLGGLPKWLPFLDRLAETNRVIAPSLPGFPGGPLPDNLDTPLDWLMAAGDVFDAGGLDGADLIGASVGGALAAEVAAAWPGAVRKLVLIAPFGIFDENAPITDVFAQRPGGMSAVLSQKPDELDSYMSLPEGTDPGDWEVMALRANIAAANILWPIGDTKLIKRLPRIDAPTLVIWGKQDRIIPPSYVSHFKSAIGGKVSTKIVDKAGHRAEFDQPSVVARAIRAFLAR